MLLLITGKTQSGRTTATVQLLTHLLRLPHFDQIYLLDGKGNQLNAFAPLDRVHYFGPKALAGATDALCDLADAIPDRYSSAQPQRLLIVADDIQVFTRAEKTGRKLKLALSTLAEAGVLGDFLILTAPRETGSVPPPVRHHATGRVRLIGQGFFFYTATGQAQRSGRIEPLSKEDAQLLVSVTIPDGELPTCACIPQLLDCLKVPPTRTPATLYLGGPGSGKTHALRHHPTGATERHLYVDLSQPHRAILAQIITQGGAAPPKKAPISDLAEVAALTVATTPTLLFFDNLDQASPKTIPSIDRLMTSATAVALAATAPTTPAQRRKLKPFFTRCVVKELRPLDHTAARQLLWNTLDRQQLERPGATEKRILRAAAGNPGNLIKLAHRVQRGDTKELREIYTPVKRINVGWILVLIIIAAAMVSRRVVDSYIALGILTMLTLGLRPFMYKLFYSSDD